MVRSLVVVVVVIVLGMASAIAAVYDDEAQFLTQLGTYDLVDFNDVNVPPMVESSGDRYLESHGILIEAVSPGGIWVSDNSA